MYQPPLLELFNSSKVLVLDLDQYPDEPDKVPMREFFNNSKKNNMDPTLPENRQKFQDTLLSSWGVRYLIGQYGEDRKSMLEGSQIAKEGRTIHLAIDIFCKDLEPVISPCDGEIVRIDKEAGDHSFGNYLILRPDSPDQPLLFFGHLAENNGKPRRVKTGETIAEIGDFINNENGGWSRHLHLQLLSSLPKLGEIPIGYSSKQDFMNNSRKYPSPMNIFPDWKIII